MSDKKIILASASPRRRELMKELGIDFIVVKSRVKEVSGVGKPADIVKYNALKKAVFVSGLKTVRKKYKDAVIIGADTIVVIETKGSRRIIGKPKNRPDARRILGMLSGTTHSVYTGLAVKDLSSGRVITGYEKSRVTMRKLGRREMEKAVKRHMDKAGAYGIQEKGDRFVRMVKGPVDNVVGLPCKKLSAMLKKIN